MLLNDRAMPLKFPTNIIFLTNIVDLTDFHFRWNMTLFNFSSVIERVLVDFYCFQLTGRGETFNKYNYVLLISPIACDRRFSLTFSFSFFSPLLFSTPLLSESDNRPTIIQLSDFLLFYVASAVPGMIYRGLSYFCLSHRLTISSFY